MPYEKINCGTFAKKIAAAALCLALSMVALAACSGQPAASGSSSGDASSAASVASSEATTIDTSAWKTLGDALAVRTEEMGMSQNENYYVCMFKAGDSYVRVVAKMEPGVEKKIDSVDWSKDNVNEQIEEAASSLSLVSAEDVTSQLLSQSGRDELVGKTGQQLVDEGWIFTRYFMYGGEQTGAAFDKGPFSYGVTFDVSIDEKDTEDEGKSIMDATVAQVEVLGAGDNAIDPTKIS